MKKLVSIVLIFAIAAAVIQFGGSEGHSAGKNEKKAIYVVFDNSGSMYMDNNPAWSQATYAMEVFASMLNFSQGDVMRVYTMHDVTTSDGGRGSSTSTFDIKNKKDIEKIHNMFTEVAAGTPYTPVKKAAKDLAGSSADEKWLVILTDGAFDDEAPSEGLDNALKKTAQSDDNLYVQYLAIGSYAIDLTGSPKDGFYADRAAASEDVVEKLADIGNRIFRRNSIPDFEPGSAVYFDVPVSRVIVFAQGEQITVDSLVGPDGTPVTEKDRNLVSHSTTGGTGTYRCVVDSSLKGVVVTYENESTLPIGEYILNMSGGRQMDVYFEPDVKFTFDLYKNGNKVTRGETITAGEYTVRAGFVDGTTGDFIEKSTLIGNVNYEIQINDQVYRITAGEGGKVEQSISLTSGDLEITCSASYLSGYIDQDAGKYTVSMLDILLAPDEEGYNVKELDQKNNGVLITVKKSGELFSEEEWLAMDLPEVVSFDKLDWAVERGTDVSTFTAYPMQYQGDLFRTDTGELEFSVAVTADIDGVIVTEKEDGTVTINNDRALMDYLKRYWLQIAVAIAMLILVLGYIPPFKKYLPRSLKKKPVIVKKPAGIGKKTTEPGVVEKNLISTLLPYKAQTGKARFAAMGTKPAVPKMQVKAAGRSSLYVMNYKDYAGKTYITFDGMPVDAEAKKPVKIFAGSDLRVKTPLFTSTCVLNQKEN